MKRTKIVNGQVITPYRILSDGVVEIQEGKIDYVGERGSGLPCEEEIDARGNFVSPGFVDIHTHGGGGHDFMDGTPEAILGAAELHARYGTTSIVPTTLTCPNEELKDLMAAFRIARQTNQAGAKLLGLHLEGPYFAHRQAGGQDVRYLRQPDREEYLEILSWSDDILRWSIAPELDGALELGDELARRGILAAMGHSDAEYDTVVEACEHGYRHVTHLYSGMDGVHRRNAYRFLGMVESAYLIDALTVEIIADGCHLPPEPIRLIYNIKGPGKTALITDSLRGAGMPDGLSISGSLKHGQTVIIEDGVAKMPDRTAFAGSVATTNRLVSTVVHKAGIPLLDAVRMASLTPAQILKQDGAIGSLTQGKRADILIFDEAIQILMTMIDGRIIYQSEEAVLKKTTQNDEKK